MKILVTGGAGFIGSHVSDLYIANGYDVVVIDDLSTGLESNINPAAKFYKMDICDPAIEAIFEKERPDFINHHAALMNVRRSVAEPLFDAHTNILGSINLLECARKYGVQRIIYISSGELSMESQNTYPVMRFTRLNRFARMVPVNIKWNITSICIM